jgi:Flp pilus assembly pilin Flp
MLKTYIKVRETIVGALRNDEGASLAEYALIIAIVLIGAGVVLATLTGAVNNALNDGTSCLNAGIACS